MVVLRTMRLQFLVVCPSFGCPYMVNNMATVEFHCWGVKIYGCPLDNCVSIFGCPATFLVVPGLTQQTKMLSLPFWNIQ